MDVERCGLSLSKVASHTLCNAAALLSHVPVAILSCSYVFSLLDIPDSMKETELVVTVAAHDTSDKLSRLCKLQCMVRRMYIHTHVLYIQNTTLNALVWGSLTLAQCTYQTSFPPPSLPIRSPPLPSPSLFLQILVVSSMTRCHRLKLRDFPPMQRPH